MLNEERSSRYDLPGVVAVVRLDEGVNRTWHMQKWLGTDYVAEPFIFLSPDRAYFLLVVVEIPVVV